MLIRELHDVVPVIAKRLTAFRFDDDRAVRPVRFLESRMTVVPIGARLLQGKPIDKGLPRRNTVETDGWHTIHLERQDEPVPVD
jgi:hypothetical protein